MISDNKITITLGLGFTLNFYQLTEKEYDNMCVGNWSYAVPMTDKNNKKAWGVKDDYGYHVLPLDSWLLSINNGNLQVCPECFYKMLNEKVEEEGYDKY